MVMGVYPQVVPDRDGTPFLALKIFVHFEGSSFGIESRVCVLKSFSP